jgi:hypothetical protein
MAPFGPWSLRVGRKLRYEIGGTDDIGIAKGYPDVRQEFDAHGAVLRPAREEAGRMTRLLWPFTTGEVGNGQKRPPVIGGAVVQPIGYLRVGIDQQIETVDRPARRLAAQRGEFLAVASTQTHDLRVRRFAL